MATARFLHSHGGLPQTKLATKLLAKTQTPQTSELDSMVPLVDEGADISCEEDNMTFMMNGQSIEALAFRVVSPSEEGLPLFETCDHNQKSTLDLHCF